MSTPTPKVALRPPVRRPRWIRGISSAMAALAFPLGRWWPPKTDAPGHESERLEKGLTIVLPGVEGRSSLNAGIVQGLRDAGLDSAVEIFDWTTGFSFLFLHHLRGRPRHRRQAEALAARIVGYQDRYPGRPVHLIGHSGGAMALRALEALPADRIVTSAVLLAAAVSRRYDLDPVLARTERGIWNFHSPFDTVILGMGTMLLGTLDGRRCVSAGTFGFHSDPPKRPDESDAPHREGPRLHQRSFRLAMAGQFHFGGHFGCTNRVFIAETVAPLLCHADEGS